MQTRKFTREYKREAVRQIRDRGVSYVQISRGLARWTAASPRPACCHQHLQAAFDQKLQPCIKIARQCVTRALTNVVNLENIDKSHNIDKIHRDDQPVQAEASNGVGSGGCAASSRYSFGGTEAGFQAQNAPSEGALWLWREPHARGARTIGGAGLRTAGGAEGILRFTCQC